MTSEDGCDANCQTTGCGNGLVTTGETCDDGDTDDQDSCPGDCVVDPCTPNAGTDLTVDVNLASSEAVAALTVFLDYPEGLVDLPGEGTNVPAGIITELPGFVLAQSNDLNHALIQIVVGKAAFPSGLFFRAHFETCSGAPAPVVGDFTCTVSSVDGQDIEGVTCSVSVP